MVIANRFCSAALAWVPQERGYIYTLTYGTGRDALTGYGYGFKTAPVIRALRPPGVAMLKWTDDRSRTWYTWRAPFWIYVLDGLLLVQAIRFRRLIWLLPGAVTLAQQLNVTVLNPSQDARYMFVGLIIAIALLPLASVRPRRRSAGGRSDDWSDEFAAERGVGADEVVVDGVDAGVHPTGSRW